MKLKRAKHIISGIFVWQGTIWGLAAMKHFWGLDQWLELYPAFVFPYAFTMAILMIAGVFFGAAMIFLGIFGGEKDL